MKIIITGATGFIGKQLLLYLLEHNCQVCVIVRSKLRYFHPNLEQVLVGGEFTSLEQGFFEDFFQGYDIVIHLLGAAHLSKGDSRNDFDHFQEINVGLTKKIAQAATKANIKRFIFVSTIGVHGIYSDELITEQSKINPHNLYSQSKLDAEKELQNIVTTSDMQVIILRPPMVYGSNASGSFKSLVKAARYRIPLPFGKIGNRRSFISISNLVDLLFHCCVYNGLDADIYTFVVCDDETISMTVFLKKIRSGLGVRQLLVPFPSKVLRTLLLFLKKDILAYQLLDSLEIDMSHAKYVLKWQPKVSVYEELLKLRDI